MHDPRVMLRTALLAAISAGGLAAPALAHETWLWPRSSAVEPGEAITLDLTSGMAFPALEYAIRPERVATAQVRVGGKAFPIPRGRSGRKALELSVRVGAPGTALVFVELAPRVLELAPAKIQEYLEEIGGVDTIGKEWAARRGPKRWREEYVKHAKTFVAIGTDQAEDHSWSKPAGMALEIVPETNPLALRRGDRLRVRVLKQGRPFPGFALSAMCAGKVVATTRTDAAGRAEVALDEEGRWLLSGTELRPSSRPGLEWQSDFTTLTLAVPGPIHERERAEAP